ncbi:unnamed protein product [Paramecium sonneborni]|uniref:Transmembrane protein n=1 Tax=Paramecium sonneborni TaxID=65129 RepID=A0A8S1PVW4_9CILI|nr:unnamed protein product [Paramecium sonneborni]
MSQFIFAILTFSYAITIYPNPQSQIFQWEYQIWIDCKNQNLIIPTNCDNDDLNWKECYEIPEQGLCLKNKLKISTQQTYNLIFTFQNFSTNIPQILLNNNPQEQKSFQNNKIAIQTFLNYSNLDIQILGTAVKLQKLVLTSDCNLNCQECDENFECIKCFDNFSMINYQCLPDSCFQVLSNLTTQSALSANSMIVNQSAYQVTVDFNIELGQCLVPKIYLVNQIESNKIEFILETKQIQIKTQKQLNFQLTLNQINQYCKLIFQNKEKTIHQCSLGVALTNAQITYYNLIILGEVTTNLQTSSLFSSTQVINIPENGKVKLEVSNEITKVQINKDLISISQTIYNDNLKIDTVLINEAFFIQNGQQYDSLEFLASFVGKQQITYKFKIKEINMKFDQKMDLVLRSELIESKRILIKDRQQLRIEYYTKNLIQFLPNELSQSIKNQKSNLGVKGPIFAIAVILLVSLWVTIQWQNKKQKKQHHEIDEEDIENDY